MRAKQLQDREPHATVHDVHSAMPNEHGAPQAEASLSWHEIYCRLAAGEDYDRVVYAPDSYGSFIWELQKPIVLDSVKSLARRRQNLNYLDFACGTARVLASIQPFVTNAVGIDLSGAMLARAAQRAPAASLLKGDLLKNPTLADYNYNLITAFRFFLNADTDKRLPTLRCLAERLHEERSLLIFNIHGNSHSLDRLAALRYHSSTMSMRQIRELTERAGLLIEAWYGFGLMPAYARAPRLQSIARAVDIWAARHQALRAISRDLLFVCRLR
jgi:SAM-dependent methyltransferase